MKKKQRSWGNIIRSLFPKYPRRRTWFVATFFNSQTGGSRKNVTVSLKKKKKKILCFWCISKKKIDSCRMNFFGNNLQNISSSCNELVLVRKRDRLNATWSGLGMNYWIEATIGASVYNIYIRWIDLSNGFLIGEENPWNSLTFASFTSARRENRFFYFFP